MGSIERVRDGANMCFVNKEDVRWRVRSALECRSLIKYVLNGSAVRHAWRVETCSRFVGGRELY